MTIQFQEYPDSRSASATRDSQTRTLHYWLSGIHDDAAARAYINTNAPPLFDGYYRQGADLDPKGNGFWEVEVNYGSLPDKETGSVSFTFDTTGGTAHITQSKDTMSRTAITGVAPDHNGAINVTESGPAGTDIVIAQFSWTENWTLPISYASFTAAMLYKAVTGKVNGTEFRGFGAGQVRFDGANGGASTKDPTQASISFRFTQSDDTNDAVPKFKAGIVKLGWEYLWLEYKKDEDTTANEIKQPPLYAFVERVYDTGEFSGLGIGTGLL